MDAHRILIVEDDVNSAKYLARILNSSGFSADYVCGAEEALDLLPKVDYDLLLIDFILPKLNGLALLKRVKEIDPHILAIFITAHGSITLAVDALKSGASDFLEKPVLPEKLLLVMNRVLEERRLKNEVVALKANLQERYRFGNLVGKHKKMQQVFDLIQSLAAVDSPVLVTGETGTGKDLVAKAIHFHSRRRNKPFVAIDCASVPETLLESELFGFEKGAFTGALKRKPGKMEQAQGGTLLLDEIGDMPYALQSKLLRAVQERKVERLGGNRPVSLDVRIIAATNKDLETELSGQRFRPDLYYRINVVPLHLPPLRERSEDIPLLAEHFLTQIAERNGSHKPVLSANAMSSLVTHSWPGNVRELENVVERAMVLSQDDTIEVIPFHGSGSQLQLQQVEYPLDVDVDRPLKTIKQEVISRIEREYFIALLRRHKGSIKRTAADAEVDTRTVLRKMNHYGLTKSDFK
jgi:DNA-binding NtrC family response regulator